MPSKNKRDRRKQRRERWTRASEGWCQQHNKTFFPSRKAAKAQIRFIAEAGISAYACGGQWHIGHDRGEQLPKVYDMYGYRRRDVIR